MIFGELPPLCLVALSLLRLVASAAPANPINVKSSQWLSNYQASPNDPYILRDGGLAGQIGGLQVLTYSDTLVCANQSQFEHPTDGGCRFLAGNTIVKCSYVASQVFDYSQPTPQVFCDQAGTGVSGDGNRLHLSNLIPTGATTGAIWYVEEANQGNNGCNEVDGCPVANGVAAVSGSDPINKQPTCSPQTGFWDSSAEPVWGLSAVAGSDGYIYLWGQLDGIAGGSQYNDVYIARVLNGSQLNYNAYQYWNGTKYTTTRLRYPNYNGYSPSSVIPGVEAFGSAHYNPYYQRYIVLAVNKTMGNQILAWSAARPEGPYSAPISLYQNNSIGGYYDPIYAPDALTMFDTSGKTLTINWSIFGRNTNNGVVKLVKSPMLNEFHVFTAPWQDYIAISESFYEL